MYLLTATFTETLTGWTASIDVREERGGRRRARYLLASSPDEGQELDDAQLLQLELALRAEAGILSHLLRRVASGESWSEG